MEASQLVARSNFLRVTSTCPISLIIHIFFSSFWLHFGNGHQSRLGLDDIRKREEARLIYRCSDGVAVVPIIRKCNSMGANLIERLIDACPSQVSQGLKGILSSSL